MSQVYPFLLALRSDLVPSESNRRPLGPLVRSLVFCPSIATSLERKVSLCMNEILRMCPRLEDVQVTLKGPWDWPSVHGFECFIPTLERVASSKTLKKFHLDLTQAACIPLPMMMSINTLVVLTLAVPNIEFHAPSRKTLIFPQLQTLVFVVKSPRHPSHLGDNPDGRMRWSARSLINISKCVDAPDLHRLTICANHFPVHVNPTLLAGYLLEVVQQFGTRLRYLHMHFPKNEINYEPLVEACPGLEHFVCTLSGSCDLQISSHPKLRWIDLWDAPIDPSRVTSDNTALFCTALPSFRGFRLLDHSLALFLDLPLLLPPDDQMQHDEIRLVTLPDSVDVVQTNCCISWQDPSLYYDVDTDEDPDYEPSDDDDASERYSSFEDDSGQGSEYNSGESVDLPVDEDADGIALPPNDVSNWKEGYRYAEVVLEDIRPLLSYFGRQVSV